MMKILKLKFVFLAALALLLSGCFADDSVTRNIRVIAQAEVDGKTVEGSAVMSLRWVSDGKEGGWMQPKSNTEPVILELNDKHTIYVLDAYLGVKRGGPNISYWTTYVASALGFNLTVRLSNFPTIKNASGRYPVDASISKTKTMPVMVSFADETKRETMFHVTHENFSQKFGSNAKFIGLWFEFTDDPITEMIEQRLPLMFQRKVNESYREKYPLKDKNGNLIPRSERKFPQFFGETAFKKKSF